MERAIDTLSGIKTAAQRAAMRDGYDQIVVRESDGTYSFTRAADGVPTTPLFYDDEVMGVVRVFWKDGRMQSEFVSKNNSETG